jgi:hypothetical protein
MPKPLVQLYDKSGKGLLVDDSEAASKAYLSGSVVAKKGTSIGVYTPDAPGKPSVLAEVPAEDLQLALSQGAKIAPDAEINKARIEAKWEKKGLGPVARGVRALGLGAVHGLGAGFLDGAVPEVARAFMGPDAGRDVKEFAEDSKVINPGMRTVGDIAGTIGGIALTGGSSGVAKGGAVGAAKLGARALARGAAEEGGARLLARGAKEVAEEGIERAVVGAAAKEAAKEGVARTALRYNPAGLVDALGGGVDNAVKAGIESAFGQGTAARLGARVAGGAARGVTEGAIYGLGEAASEAALGDEKVTAEKVWAHIGHDALMFGKFGAAGGAAVGVLERLASSAAPALRKSASEQYARAIGASKSEVQKMLKKGNLEEYASFLEKNGIVKAGDNIENMSARAADVSDGVLNRWGDLGTKMGGSSKVVEANQFIKRVNDEILDRRKIVLEDGKVVWELGLRDTPGAKHIVREIENVLGEYSALAEKNGGYFSFDTARNLRKNADKLLGAAFNSVEPSFRAELKMGVRGILEDEIEKGVDKYAKEAKKAGLLEEYLALKKDHGYAKDAVKMTQRGLAGEITAGSNLSYLSGSPAAAMAGGAAAGAFLGGPGGAFSGAALAGANRLVKSRGAATSAWAFGRLADLGTMRSFVDGTTKNIDRGAAAFVRGSGKEFRLQNAETSRPGRPSKDDLGTRFALLTAKVQRAAIDPESTSKSVAQATAGMERVAPNVQMRVQAKTMQAASYLRTKLPEGKTDPLQPGIDKRNSIPDAEKAKFLEIADGTLNPLSLIEDMTKGTVSPDKVQAVKDNHPELFKEIQDKMMLEVNKMTAKGEYLPYQKRIQLGITFGIPADDSLRPEYIKRMQSNFQPQQEGAGGAGGAGGGRGPGRPAQATANLTKMFGTVFDKRAAGLKNP